MAKKTTRLEELHNTFQENGISPETVMENDALIREIKKHADAVQDYRHSSYIHHLLGDIIMIVFFAVLGNANEWGEIESFGKARKNGFAGTWNFRSACLPMIHTVWCSATSAQTISSRSQ